MYYPSMQKAHADQNMRYHAWEARRTGMDVLAGLLGAYRAYSEVLYSPDTVSYDVVVHIECIKDSVDTDEVVTFREDFKVFPSEHLKTKILLVTGGGN